MYEVSKFSEADQQWKISFFMACIKVKTPTFLKRLKWSQAIEQGAS